VTKSYLHIKHYDNLAGEATLPRLIAAPQIERKGGANESKPIQTLGHDERLAES